MLWNSQEALLNWNAVLGLGDITILSVMIKRFLTVCWDTEWCWTSQGHWQGVVGWLSSPTEHHPASQLLWLQGHRRENRRNKGEKTCRLKTFNKQTKEEKWNGMINTKVNTDCLLQIGQCPARLWAMYLISKYLPASVFIAKPDFIWQKIFLLIRLGQLPLLCPFLSSCTPLPFPITGSLILEILSYSHIWSSFFLLKYQLLEEPEFFFSLSQTFLLLCCLTQLCFGARKAFFKYKREIAVLNQDANTAIYTKLQHKRTIPIGFPEVWKNEPENSIQLLRKYTRDVHS